MTKEMKRRIRLGMEECLSGVENRPSLESRVLERIQGQRRAPAKLTVAMVMVLALTLLTAAALAVGAISGWFRVEQQQVGAMQSCVSDGDTLYLLTDRGLYTWQTDDSEPALMLSAEQLWDNGFSPEALLCRMGDELALLHPETRFLWQVDGQKLQPLAEYRGTILDEDGLQIRSMVCAGETLLIRAVPQDAREDEAQLFRWHLPTGSVEQLPLPHVVELCAYDDAHVLVLQQDVSVKEEHLSRIDAATGSIVEILYTAPVQGMEGIMVHPKTRQIIAFVAGAPCLWNGSGWEPMQGYGLSIYTDAYAVIGDSLAAINFNDLQVIPLAAENSLTTLSIRGIMPLNNEDDTFQQQFPGIAVQRERDPALTAADIRQAIADGDTTDLFHVRLTWDVAALFRDGTLAALPSSAVLEEDAQAMLPAFQEGLSVDGAWYAVPSNVLVSIWESSEAVPATFVELLEAQAGAASPYIAPHWSGIGWTKENDADYLLTTMILASGTEDVDFHAPAFADALQALRAAQFSTETQPGVPVITTDLSVDLHGQLAVPVQPGEDRVYSQSEPDQPAPILWQVPSGIAAELPPTIPAHLTVYVLNPNAANPELALRFLEYVAAHRQPEQDALLKPMTAEPVLHPGVEAQIEWIIEEQRTLDEAQGLATDEEALERRIHAIKTAPDSWAVDETRLQTYRERIVPYVRLQLHPLLSRQAKETGGAYDRMLQTVLAYANGEGTLEDCLHKLEALLP